MQKTAEANSVLFALGCEPPYNALDMHTIYGLLSRHILGIVQGAFWGSIVTFVLTTPLREKVMAPAIESIIKSLNIVAPHMDTINAWMDILRIFAVVIGLISCPFYLKGWFRGKYRSRNSGKYI